MKIRRIVIIFASVLVVLAIATTVMFFSDKSFIANNNLEYLFDSDYTVGEAITEPEVNNDSITSEIDTEEPKIDEGEGNNKNPITSQSDPNPDSSALLEKVTLSDKAKATNLVFGRLSAEEIETLQGYVRNGLTPEDKQKAINLAYSKFTKDEIEFIKSMYNKYMR